MLFPQVYSFFFAVSFQFSFHSTLPSSHFIYCLPLYGCTTWTLTKHMEKKIDGNYTRMLRTVLNKSWRQHPTKQQHLPPITKNIQIRWIRHAGHCWRSKDELVGDVLLWTPSHGWANFGQPARIYLQHFCANTGCKLEDLPGTMDDRDKWQDGVRKSVLAVWHDDDQLLKR